MYLATYNMFFAIVEFYVGGRSPNGTLLIELGDDVQ